MNKKILFVCKHNIFRSRVAEEYSKANGIEANSAGLIPCPDVKILSEQEDLAKEFKLDLTNKSKPITLPLLDETNKLIIVADDVPPEIFSNIEEVVVWKIEDIGKNMEEDSRDIINKIIKKVDEELLDKNER